MLAVDLHARKARNIEEAAGRLGLPEVRALAADATLPLPGEGPFDVALVDAPCSGLGTLRRHPEVRLVSGGRADVWLASGHARPPDGRPLVVQVHEASWADAELRRVLAPAFAAASGKCDGAGCTAGIRLHVQVDEQIPHVDNTALVPCTGPLAAGAVDFVVVPGHLGQWEAAAIELATGYTDQFSSARRHAPVATAAQLQQELLPPRIARHHLAQKRHGLLRLSRFRVHDRVMFAADYPFESMDEAAHFIDGVALDEKLRNDICFNNAAKLFRLGTGARI